MSQVQSKRSSETYRNFANGFIYNSVGAVTAMRLGSGKWENTVFNSRMQPTKIGLGNGVNSQNLLKLDYEYGATASVNNGNVTKQTTTVPGVAHDFVQSYTYDELNRLTRGRRDQKLGNSAIRTNLAESIAGSDRPGLIVGSHDPGFRIRSTRGYYLPPFQG